MKSRLAASVSPFISHGTIRRNGRAVLFRILHCQTSSSFQYQGFESSSEAVHSSALENDDFSELGPEKTKSSGKQIKLVTEKPDHFVKTDPYKRKLAGRPTSPDTRPSIQGMAEAVGRFSPNSDFKLGGHTCDSTHFDETRSTRDMENPCSVSIKNILPAVGLSELVEAISVFGKVSSASFANASNALKCCHIEFLNADSRTRAISAGKIAVGHQLFPVCPPDAVDVVAVRIKNINSTTADFIIHSKCKAAGEFVGLARTSKDIIEAYYNLRNETKLPRILKKLNGTVIDGSCWSADTLLCKSTPSEVSPKKEAKSKLGLQIFDHISELRGQQTIKRIYLDDFESLHASIMHIEHPPSNTG